jgi:hypothetical protein
VACHPRRLIDLEAAIMAISGISKYRPQLYTPRNLSTMNKQAADSARDSISSAADTFASQMTDFGSSQVTLIIQQTAARIQAQARAKMAASTSSLNLLA